MSKQNEISTNRIEAFSDGVIAIIITVMIFDLKVHASKEIIAETLFALIPKFISYAVSFVMVAIMWVNHHQLFHQIKHTDRSLLWYSIHLLFWMSLVPFATNFIGEKPFVWQASFCYGFIFFMSAFAFTRLRGYVIKKELLFSTISKQAHLRIKKKNKIALGIYLSGALISSFSVYIAFACFLIVPAMYVIPEKIIHLEN